VSHYDAQIAIRDQLVAAGVNATDDPRSATPPCVLVPPPDRRYDLACSYTAIWHIWALAPNPGNADTSKVLDDLCDAVADVLDVSRMTLRTYNLSNDSGQLPAYDIEMEQGV